MLSNIKRKMRKEEEEGFTLIELLVVVLILGILMAIAIPTFLSLTSGAKTSAAESDLTTASQDEATYFTTNGSYDGISSTYSAATNSTDNVVGTTAVPGMKGIDAGINWVTSTTTLTSALSGTKTVQVTFPGPTLAAGILLGTVGTNASFYWVSAVSGSLSYDIDTTAAPTAATVAGWAASTTCGSSWKTACTT
jgi:type IV pilus assembly protein PilA